MPQPWVARAVIRAIRRLPGYPNLAVLDLSCGEGEILGHLHRDGCTCRGTHYREDDYVIQQEPATLSMVPIDQDVDLTRPLPYTDRSYDLVVMSEVLEHLPSHDSIIREVARVLRPNGYFIFSTPNIHRVQSRWQFFWSGTHKLVRRRVGWDLMPDDLYAYHIHPVDFPLMHTLLFQSNLCVEDVRFTRLKAAYASWLLLYPLFWLGTRLKIHRRRKEAAIFSRGEQDLFRWMVKPAMLSSDQILVVTRLQAAAVPRAYAGWPQEAHRRAE